MTDKPLKRTVGSIPVGELPWLPKEEKEIDYRAWDEALAKRAAAKHKLVELTERAEREEAK